MRDFLPQDVRRREYVIATVEETYRTGRDRVLGQFEAQYFARLLDRASGNMSLAARLAGVDRTTLYRLMGRHQLHRTPRTGWLTEGTEGTNDRSEMMTGTGGP